MVKEISLEKSIHKLPDGTELHIEIGGTGEAVIFIHGVMMSSRFFDQQKTFFADQNKAVFVDLRGHGQSSDSFYGHTVPTYAKDIHHIINSCGLKNVTLVGWSMGAFVVWDYLTQFGEENIKATVIIDEFASDYKWDDYDFGFADLPTLKHLMELSQTNYAALCDMFIDLMFKNVPSEKDQLWMRKEICSIAPSSASTIFFDQSVRDYRPVLKDITVPTLICIGRDEKLIPVAAGEDLAQRITNSKLEIFENSGHCPFFEEADHFNHIVSNFLRNV